MLFSSLTFIFYFLLLCLVLYYVTPKKYLQLRNVILLVFSLLFYAWGEPKYIFLMLFTVFVSYIFGLLIHYFDHKQNKKMKLCSFVIVVILIISSLLYFKYTNFFIESINGWFKVNFEIKNIVLPIGISFYTFQILSYVIDLYRNRIKVQKNFFNLALYISFFPQLIAGPIVTYQSIEDQLTNRKETLEKFGEGLERFIIGLGKKVLIANQMALIADAVFNSASLNEFSSLVVLMGVLAYTFQIYFDFSGYSDMAIGLGRMFGFEFLENFNYPYMAKSVTDFWKKWHISLTTFFREYIYIPLGGNRVSKKRWIVNMFIVWLLTGFWHGAAWNFIFWGLYYCLLLLIEKTFLKERIKKIPSVLRFIFTFILINIGWVLFRANTLQDVFIILKNMLAFHNVISLRAFVASQSDLLFALPFMLFAIIFSFNVLPKLNERFHNNVFYLIVKKICILGIFVLCISSLVSSLYNPFIYFRF